MLVEYQEFKFGLIRKQLELISSKYPHEPKFVYLSAVLNVFRIQDAAGFEADGELVTDGVNVDYMRD
ncbi:hypothetical protein BGZ79_008985, partial [Entomortierella chlamydospora]